MNNIRVNILFLLISLSVFAHGQNPISRGNQVKAVFLFNFSQFVEWPDSCFTGNDQPFVIGILGQDPFGSFLDETVKDERTTGHPMVVQRYENVKDITNCQILFVNADLANSGTIDSLKQTTHMLTVSDAESFAKSGGMIQFVTANNKIGLQINIAAVKTVNLVISSKLLRLAEIIE